MFDQNVPNSLTKNPNFFTHKVLAAIGIILIVTIIIAAGIWYYSTGRFSTPTTDDNAIKVATTSSTVATTSSVPSDWKTYTNTKYKYSLKYPSGSEVVNGVEQLPDAPAYTHNTNTTTAVLVQSTGAAGNYFGLIVIPTSKTLNDTESELMKDKNNTDFTRVKVGGFDAISFKYYGNTSTIKVINNGNEYEFTITDAIMTNKILSTFKFL